MAYLLSQQADAMKQHPVENFSAYEAKVLIRASTERRIP
jgi:hypothetical protein